MAKTDKQRFSNKRFKALIAHIVAKCDRPLTKEELCWLLYHCDRGAYVKLGRSITGATYVKGEKSPIPCHL